ncbi:uncharacterized protein LOC102808667 [Saccoglossus kowalevskii]|uniref:Uncharacterized protein LOC102808667 n=1 Tax=Saccoglossus kowalevskii TaxID=10224 RepID=A0ABM0M7Q6_SACKO|nr:PREDICTED: uncharacterized protein LOC102808667 [Saccoglossus kowalevskii]
MMDAKGNVFTGATLMIFGCIYLGLGITCLALRNYGWQIGFHLWGALVFIVTAVYGLLANNLKKRDLIHGYTIFCVACIATSIILIIGLSIGIANEYFGGYCTWFDWFMIDGCSAPVARMVIDIIYLCFASLGLVLAIGCTYVAGKYSHRAEEERVSKQKVYRN